METQSSKVYPRRSYVFFDDNLQQAMKVSLQERCQSAYINIAIDCYCFESLVLTARHFDSNLFHRLDGRIQCPIQILNQVMATLDSYRKSNKCITYSQYLSLIIRY